jgi:hypothetical protein
MAARAERWGSLLGYVLATTWPMFDKRTWFPDGPVIFLANDLISMYARFNEIADARCLMKCSRKVLYCGRI